MICFQPQRLDNDGLVNAQETDEISASTERRHPCGYRSGHLQDTVRGRCCAKDQCSAGGAEGRGPTSRR